MSGIGAAEIGFSVILLVGLVSVVFPIVGLVDAARRPAPAWTASGQNQTLWIALNAVGIVVCGIGAIIGLVYLLTIRPQVARAESVPPPPPPPGPG